MPFNPDTGLFERDWSFVDHFDKGDEINREDLDHAINEILSGVNHAISNGMHYLGDWSALTAFPTSRPDGRPIGARDSWRVSAGGTVDGVSFNQDDYLVALVSRPHASYRGSWIRIPHSLVPEILTLLSDIQDAADQVSSDREAASNAKADAEIARDEAVAVASITRTLETFGPITGTDLATDMETWDSALAWAHVNKGTIIAPPGKSSVIGSLRLRSFVKLETHGHTFRVSGSVGFTQNKSRQLFGVVTDELYIVPNASDDESARVWDLSVVQSSVLRWHSDGFSDGEDFYLETQTLTEWDHLVWPFTSSNTIYCEFVGFSTQTRRGMTIKGHYGDTPGGGNNSPAPAGVVTKNIVSYFGWDFSEVLLDIDRCCDSDEWLVDGRAREDDAVFVKMGDPTYRGNNYVNSHKIRLVAARAPGVEAVTIFSVQSWTFGHRFDVENDINATLVAVTEIELGDTLTNDDFDYFWSGKGVDSALGNTSLFLRGENYFIQAGNGSAARPSYSFNRERNMGFFRGAAGRISMAFGGIQRFLFEAGRIAVPSGTPEAPAITFIGDPGLNSGLYLEADNQIGVSTGGVGRIGISDTAVSVSTPLMVNTTSGGFLLPRLTESQRDALTAPANGLLIYNSTTDKGQMRAAGVWVDLW